MSDYDINIEAEIKKLQEKRAQSGTVCRRASGYKTFLSSLFCWYIFDLFLNQAFGLAANSEFNMFEDEDNMLKEIDFNKDETDAVPEKFKVISSYSAPKAILEDVIAGKDDFVCFLCLFNSFVYKYLFILGKKLRDG